MNYRDRDTREWLKFASEDLKTSEFLVTNHFVGPARQACGLAQQAAEKAIKAALIYMQIDFPKSHDLDKLRNMLPPDWKLHQQYPILRELTQWAVESRYPGDWPTATNEQAKEMAKIAHDVLDSITVELANVGFSENDDENQTFSDAKNRPSITDENKTKDQE